MNYGSDDDCEKPIRTRRDYHKCHKCPFKTTLTFRMPYHVMTHNFPKHQRLFSCANSIEALNCSQCSNFQTHKLADLKHHFKAGHTLTESKEDLYECKSCSFQTHSKYLILRHKLLNLCLANVKVKSEEALSEGSNEFQTADQRYKCDFSHFKSEDKQILLDHTKLCHHLNDDLGNFQCHNCLYKIPSKSLLDDHLTKKHKSDNSKYRKCEYCPFTTKRISDLKRHILVRHTDPENIQWFECERCSFKSKIKFDLKKHIRAKHIDPNEIQWFKCEQCSFKTKTKGYLKVHAQIKHTDADKIQWFKCEDCAFKTKIKGDLRRHIIVKHTDAGEIKCEDCSFRTKTKWTLKKHVRAKHTDPNEIQWFKCEDCPFKSKTKENLKTHIMFKHTDASELQWFQCESCSFKSKTKWHLKQHVDHKHGHKEYLKCEHCPLVTKYVSVLAAHVLAKHANPDDMEWFYCAECPYETNVKRYLRRHVAVHQKQLKKSAKNLLETV